MFGDEGTLVIGGRVAATLVEWTLECARLGEPWVVQATMGERSDYLLGFAFAGAPPAALRLQLKGATWSWVGIGVEPLGEHAVRISGTEKPEVQGG
jgi:hypothetical protein